MTWPLSQEERLELAELKPPWTPRFVFLLAADVRFERERQTSGS